MKLSVYKTRDLQHVLQILTQAEEIGITDIRFVRKKLHGHIYKVKKNRTIRFKQDPDIKLCSKCENGVMLPIDSGEPDLKIILCGTCRYSKIVGNSNG